MPTVHANGLDIGYEVHGAGPPLVMLHGATSAGREDFAAQVPLFSKAFQVFLPDARGHATTRWDVADGWSYGQLVDDLAAFADALGLTTFHLLGFSMGAMTALQFAARWPERLRTLIVAGITTQREPRASVARRLMDPDWIDRNEPTGGGAGPPARSRPGRRRLAPAPAGHRPRRGGPAAPRAARPAPDRAAGAGRGRRSRRVRAGRPRLGLARQLPDGRLLVAPDCPHEIMARRPALFNEACAEFYRSTETIARGRSAGTWQATDGPAADPAADPEGGSM